MDYRSKNHILIWRKTSIKSRRYLLPFLYSLPVMAR